jgi:hypothetical protein
VVLLIKSLAPVPLPERHRGSGSNPWLQELGRAAPWHGV